jgi:hypothetical protein
MAIHEEKVNYQKSSQKIPKVQPRDFGASYLSVWELEGLIKKISKKARKATTSKKYMYNLQINAYAQEIQNRTI